MTGKLLGEKCHIANDCMSFCCNNDDKSKEGLCVKKKNFKECSERKKLSYIILAVIVATMFMITMTCVFLKLKRDKIEVH